MAIGDFLDSAMSLIGSGVDKVSTIADDVGEFFGDEDIWGTVTSVGKVFIEEGIRNFTASEIAEQNVLAGHQSAGVFYANADLLYAEADRVEDRTLEALIRQEYEGLHFMARQQMQYMASGVTLDGSPLLVAEETRDLLELELLDIRDRGAAEAERLRKQAAIQVQQGENAIDAGDFAAEAEQTGALIDTAKNVLGL